LRVSKTVYVSIGNSDDKLSQGEWSLFVATVRAIIQRGAARIHGTWFSEPDAPWQNACWCFEPPTDPADVEHMKFLLEEAAVMWRQDSIAWADAITQFVSGVTR
jgi:hypothetical protein